jgi:hypothetical protein
MRSYTTVLFNKYYFILQSFLRGSTALERTLAASHTGKKVKQSRYTPWRCLGGEEI